MTTSPYETDLDRNDANYVPLSPLSFLPKAAAVHPNRTAIVHGTRRQNWAETYARCRRLASALAKRGIGKSASVATLCPNVPPQYEAHFGVPMAGAVLNTINVRLDAPSIAFILDHGEADVLIVDPEFAEVAAAALKDVKREILVIDAEDPAFAGGRRIGALTYEQLLAEGDPNFAWRGPA
ncbi:MAG: AMP-binding protein, partial [Dongiaceae bacterium]